MLRLLRCLLLLLPFICTAQQVISWETLSDVNFTDKYSEEEDAYYYYPHFGFSVRALNGKEVSIRGYMLVIDQQEGVYILSKNPFSACFFCGTGGPETIIELKLNTEHRRFKTDQVVTMQGKLKLNQDDIYQCNYILENAKEIPEVP